MIGAHSDGEARTVADHLLIGILVGVVCGIAALLVISIVTLRRIDLEWRTENTRLQRALMDLQRFVERSERGVRDDIEIARHALELGARDAAGGAYGRPRALP